MSEQQPMELEWMLRITIALGDPVDLGASPHGHRRIVPIVGGSFEGTIGSGVVMNAGADFQTLTSPTLTELHATYALQTSDGALLHVENRGVRSGSAADIDAIIRGESVPPERIYFRTSPRITSGDPRYEWMSGTLFVARAVRLPDEVQLEVFRVL